MTQRGDTIVEVLIAIAVISSVLGGAYTITNKNVKNSQHAQEQSRAAKIAETQIEQLKSYIASGSLPSAGTNFCFPSTASATPTQFGTAALPAADAVYDPACRIETKYMTGIKQQPASDNYTVYISWDGPSGNRSQVSMAYKVYP
jgi:prepilin-type N-terminal cleavage/methylation domain-containing protein